MQVAAQRMANEGGLTNPNDVEDCNQSIDRFGKREARGPRETVAREIPGKHAVSACEDGRRGFPLVVVNRCAMGEDDQRSTCLAT